MYVHAAVCAHFHARCNTLAIQQVSTAIWFLYIFYPSFDSFGDLDFKLEFQTDFNLISNEHHIFKEKSRSQEKQNSKYINDYVFNQEKKMTSTEMEKLRMFVSVSAFFILI